MRMLALVVAGLLPLQVGKATGAGESNYFGILAAVW